MRNRSKTNLYSFLPGFCLDRNKERFMPQGFSIVRMLLTVFLIVLVFCIILLSITRRIKLHAYIVKQKAQFLSIGSALELFESDFGYYPPSDALDENGTSYCGAIKLCEALEGRDLKGFHPNSRFRREGKSDSVIPLYDSNTLDVRKGPYLPLESANAFRLKDLYQNIAPFDGNDFVLCDVFGKVVHIETDMKINMPILYYKADISKTAHNVDDPNDPENIYDYRDNHALLALGVPGKPEQKHSLYEDPKIFYEMTRNTRVAGPSRPYRADTYILLSAGPDGLYGTEDDIPNFDMQWKPK